jgi:hypothetical protein
LEEKKSIFYFFSLFSLINYFCFVLGYFHAFQCQEKINYAGNICKGKPLFRVMFLVNFFFNLVLIQLMYFSYFFIILI